MCDVSPTAELRLPFDPSSVAFARRFLRATGCDTHHAAALDEAELLVSELVTNGIRHGVPPVVLRVGCRAGEELQVWIRDGDSSVASPSSADPEDEGGRGLSIVALLADAWGTVPEHDGKTTWFQLDRR